MKHLLVFFTTLLVVLVYLLIVNPQVDTVEASSVDELVVLRLLAGRPL